MGSDRAWHQDGRDGPSLAKALHGLRCNADGHSYVASPSLVPEPKGHTQVTPTSTRTTSQGYLAKGARDH